MVYRGTPRWAVLALVACCWVIAWPPLAAEAAARGLVSARSCSAADVRAALAAVRPGGVVTVPPGDCDWGPESVSSAKGVSLRGAGPGRTVIRSHPSSADFQRPALQLSCSVGRTYEVTGFTFVGSGTADVAKADNGVFLSGGCRGFRIHHNTFTRFGYSAVTVAGDASGVIYRNRFVHNFVMGLGYGVSVYGDGSYPAQPRLGRPRMVFVEDNTFFDNRHAIASNSGSHYVFRYNRVKSSARAQWQAQVDAHGTTEYGPGSRSWEIYRNTFTSVSALRGRGAYFIGLRGGDGVVWGNTFDEREYPYWVTIEKYQPCSWFWSHYGSQGKPVPGQTRAGYFWNNPGQKMTIQSAETGWGCDWRPYLRRGHEFFYRKLPGYTAYPYPHPLR